MTSRRRPVRPDFRIRLRDRPGGRLDKKLFRLTFPSETVISGHDVSPKEETGLFEIALMFRIRAWTLRVKWRRRAKGRITFVQAFCSQKSTGKKEY
jgi:hypothetical protein